MPFPLWRPAEQLVALVAMSLLLVNLVVPPFIAELYAEMLSYLRRLNVFRNRFENCRDEEYRNRKERQLSKAKRRRVNCPIATVSFQTVIQLHYILMVNNWQ